MGIEGRGGREGQPREWEGGTRERHVQGSRGRANRPRKWREAEHGIPSGDNLEEHVYDGAGPPGPDACQASSKVAEVCCQLQARLVELMDDA